MAWILLAALLADPAPVEHTRWVMGTSLRIVAEGEAEVLDSAFEVVEQWNDRLSTYLPESSLSEINRRAGEWVDIPVEVHRYLEASKLAAERTEGAFDITMGGLHLDEGGAVGFRLLELTLSPPRARTSRAGMALDPGGNGKGVAVDALVEVLRGAGIENALVDFGGSSWYGLGKAPDGQPWKVGLTDLEGRLVATARLSNQALSISATRKRDLDGAAAGSPYHIFDPRTRQRIEVDRTAVVVSTSATDAEVLSTALVVEGKPGFDWLARFEGASACLIRPEGLVPSQEALPWLVPTPPSPE